MAASSPGPNAPSRPLSPHIQVWRWHVTMLASILNRVTGVGSAAAAFGLVLWLVALAGGTERFAAAEHLLGGMIGQIGLYLLAVALAFHFAAGIRHLVWDAERGLHPRTAEATAWAAIVFAVLAPIGLWALAG